MSSISFTLLIVGAVVCTLYLGGCSSSLTPKETPSSISNSQPKVIDDNVKQSNGSGAIPSHQQPIRVRRGTCRYQEAWTHKCDTNCDCTKSRSCSRHGFCQDRRGRFVRENDAEYDDEY